jgi:hypothetical protein
MKPILLALAVLSILLPAGSANAEIGTLDQVPAATLLLPYFEVDLNPPGSDPGRTTTFTISNSSASAAVAHVTLWTDLGVPTTSFEVYLTGFDVEIINLRLLFSGIRPVSADAGAEPSRDVSPQGRCSQDINFPGDNGPCGSPASLYTRMSADEIAALRAAHTGQASTLLGGRCGGAVHGDNVARGFVTIDSVTTCSLALPTDPGYFAAIADDRNILFGEYWVIDTVANFEYADALVPIEASATNPLTNGAGDYTFYGRLANVNGSGADHREGLPTAWMGRFLNGGLFSEGTTAFVWRDAWPRAAFECSALPAGLTETRVVPFDEQEGVSYLPVGSAYFPLASQRVNLASAAEIPVVPQFGFMLYDLKRAVSAAPFGTNNQSFVTHMLSAWERLAVAYSAWGLDNVSNPINTAGVASRAGAPRQAGAARTSRSGGSGPAGAGPAAAPDATGEGGRR